MQIIIIEFGGKAFEVYEHGHGLTFNQWLLSITFALITFGVSIFSKFLPENDYVKVRLKL